MARIAIYVDHDFTRLRPDDEIAWREWWREHGLPSLASVAVPNKLVINTITRTISMEVYLFVQGVIQRDKRGLLRKRKSTHKFKGSPDPIPLGYLVETL